MPTLIQLTAKQIDFADLVMYILEHSTRVAELHGVEQWAMAPASNGVYLSVLVSPDGQCDMIDINTPSGIWYLHSDLTLDQVPF